MKTAIALGNFDGVHLAHKKLIENIKSFCAENNALGIAYVFCTHPRITLGDKSFRIISDNSVKEEALLSLGVDKVFFAKTTKELLETEPEDFIKNILCGELNAVYVTAGFNYRFGAGGAGNADTLQKMGDKYGFAVDILGEVTYEGETVSSSAVRRAIECGDIQRANRLMVRPFTIRGVVAQGKRLGQKIGFRTANMEVGEKVLLPKNGVYRTETLIGAKLYKSVTNVGINPTVENAPRRSETHIIGFNERIYGQAIDVIFYERIRDEIRFPSVNALTRRIEQDVKYVLSCK